MKKQINPLLGTADVHHKKEKVLLKIAGGGRRDLSFPEIQEVHFNSGRRLVNRLVRDKERMLDMIVSGPNSLLFDETEKLFYLERNDSIFTVPQAHFERALQVIFGEKGMQDYYTQIRVKPQYSARSMTNLVSFFNTSSPHPQFVYKQTLQRFKTKVSAGLYIGFASTASAFDYFYGYDKGIAMYRSTDFFKHKAIPLGLRVSVQPFRRVAVDLNIYTNRGKIEGILLDYAGFYTPTFPASVLYPRKFDTDLKLSAYAQKAVHADLSVTVFLNRKEHARLQPYIFAGPTVALLKSFEATLLAGYKDNPEASTTYLTRWYKSEVSSFMIAFHGGAGIKYALNDKLSARVSVQYTRGLFPKIKGYPTVQREENNTPTQASDFGPFQSAFVETFDQYVRMTSGGVSLMYQF